MPRKAYPNPILKIPLAQLRADIQVRQETVAHFMKVNQSTVGRIERHKVDLFVSTLKNYVEALGAQLELRVVFSDGKSIHLPFS